MTLNPLKIYTALIKNPKTKWITIILTAIYVVSPVDFIPDVLLPFGLIDDGLLVSLMLIALKEVTANKKTIDVEPK